MACAWIMVAGGGAAEGEPTWYEELGLALETEGGEVEEGHELQVYAPVTILPEDFCRLKARRCTAMDWIFILAYCFAIP